MADLTANDAPAASGDGWVPTLTTAQLAEFVAFGVLRFDSIVPPDLNQRVLEELPAIQTAKYSALVDGLATGGPDTGTPLDQCHPGSAIQEVLALASVRGVIASLVGANPHFDHDFVHHLPAGHRDRQHLHADAIADSADPTFDIQLFYFPHEVAPGAGGTRYVPGTHLRRAAARTVGRYQHIVGEQHYSGPAGTILVFHHGLWHAGDANPSATDRWMYKIRLNPQVPQVRLWNLADFDAVQNDPTDHIFATSRNDSVAAILRTKHPWQGEDPFRYDLVERVRLWRYLSGDHRFDADHYLTRLDRPMTELS